MTTVFAHGGPFYSWGEWEQQAFRRVAEFIWSNGLLTRDGMPADPARFGLITLTSRLENGRERQ